MFILYNEKVREKVMNLENIKWNKATYQEFQKYLVSLSEESYRLFSLKTITTKYEMLGIRLPTLRKIAKKISQGNILEYLKVSANNYYEEVLLKGLVMAQIKEKKLLLQYLDNYVTLIDNWAICDSFCNSLKIVVTDKDYWFLYFQKYLASSEEFKVRVGLVVYLNFFIEEKYLDEIFRLIESIKLDKYYVNMASAWLLCECFIKYPEKTLKFLQKSEINTFTFKKTISKIRDSYQVKKEVKDYLLEMKRSNENETI